MSDQLVSVAFVTGESSAPEYVAEIEKSGGVLEADVAPYDIPADLLDDYSDAQFEPLMIIGASVAVGFLIKRISDVWLDHKRPGGQVIDTRSGEVVVRAAPHLERGTLVLQSDTGVEVFHPQDKDQAIPLLEQLIVAHG